MADTASIAAMRREIIQKELFKDVKDNLYFENKGLIGTDSNNVIQLKQDLKKETGDRVTFGLTAKLSGAGITGDSTLEGNEEAISAYSDSVLIDQQRFAVRLTGRLDEQKNAYDMRMDAKEKLAMRLAEFTERQIFMKLGGVSEVDLTDTAGAVYSASAAWSNTATDAEGTARNFAAHASGIGSLTTSTLLTTTLITKARTLAELANPKIVPIRIDGVDHYVMFVHPHQAFDLKTNTSDVWAQAQREAQVRGAKNPIFSGALGVWDRVILHEHEYVPSAQATANFSSGGTAAPSGVRVYRSLLCGRQAGIMAETKASKFMVEDQFDYENKVGFATGLIGGVQKSEFNSLDYGVISVDTGSAFA